jgi:hypothetical protein
MHAGCSCRTYFQSLVVAGSWSFLIRCAVGAVRRQLRQPLACGCRLGGGGVIVALHGLLRGTLSESDGRSLTWLLLPACLVLPVLPAFCMWSLPVPVVPVCLCACLVSHTCRTRWLSLQHRLGCSLSGLSVWLVWLLDAGHLQQEVPWPTSEPVNQLPCKQRLRRRAVSRRTIMPA